MNKYIKGFLFLISMSFSSINFAATISVFSLEFQGVINQIRSSVDSNIEVNNLGGANVGDVFNLEVLLTIDDLNYYPDTNGFTHDEFQAEMLTSLDWTNHNLQSQNSGVTSIYPNTIPVTHLLVGTGDPYQGFQISADFDGRDLNNWAIGSSFSFYDTLKLENDESWLILGDLTLENTTIIATPLPPSTLLFASGLIFLFTRKKRIKIQ